MAPALDEAQRRAVQHGAGPLLVLAGPGSGKTRVVTHRIARLVESGVPPQSVLAVTFTNKAAREMRDRVRKLVGPAARGLTVSTFHSACVRILRVEMDVFAHLGYRRDFSIYDESSQRSVLRAVLRELPDGAGAGSPAAVLADLSARKGGLAPSSPRHAAGPDADDAARIHEDVLRLAGERYQEELRARNAVDFDDLILLVRRLFQENVEALARCRDRWKWLLVDEYQDTNGPQDEVIRLLAGEHRNLFAVGDDDQSIYGWRGADVRCVLDFQKAFPDARVVRLERNYRSTGAIVAVANAVIVRNPHRHAKASRTELGRGDPVRLFELDDEEDEAEHVAGEIAAEVHAAPDPWKEGSRHAVLMRTNEQSRPFEQALRRLRVPYRLLGGRSFFDRKEVQDLLAYLRVAARPDDEEALHRVVNVPPRGLGAAALQAVRRAAAADRVATYEIAARVFAGAAPPEGVSPRAARGLAELGSVVERVREAAARISPALVEDLLSWSGYRAEIDRTYADEGVRTARWNAAREVQAAWAAYLAEAREPSLLDFLDSLALGDRDEPTRDDRGVTLSTVHAAKGLEFESAWVVGLEDGLFPHARSLEDGAALEEERRLFYVAVTRAGRRLALTRCRERSLRGKRRELAASRFLLEIPEDLLERADDGPASAEAISRYLDRARKLLGAATSSPPEPPR